MRSNAFIRVLQRWLLCCVVILACSTMLLQALAKAKHAVSSPTEAGAVNPFLGVDWGGNVFVGSAVPFGMVKVGPDVETFDGRRSGFGYMSSGEVLGFSQLHLSGAQGKYGNIQLMPVTGPVMIGNIHSVRVSEQASVGYYSTVLSRYHVKAELTSTRRVGFHRYTFLDPATEAHVTVNLAACLGKGPGVEDQKFLGAEAHVKADGSVEGVARFAGGWNEGGEYKVYYAIVLDKPSASVQTYVGTPGQASGFLPQLTDDKNVVVVGDAPVGVSFNFAANEGEVVQAKVGISFISASQARASIAEEIPGWDFNAVHQAAANEWQKALQVVTLQGATPEQRAKIYTAMYHTMLMPSDRTGENPDWTSTEPYYDDYYAIWDTFRSSAPWLTLVAPKRERDLVRSLIDIYRHDGYMPDARSGNVNGRTQGGSNDDVMVTDAWERGLTGIDYQTALRAMIHDAEDAPVNPRMEGRGGLKDYNQRGYITLADERSGSRTVEYAYDDFAIGELACGLHRPQEAKLYYARAGNWKNLWDPTMEVAGFQGFLRPKNLDGTWAAPYLTVRGTWPDFMYEGDIWTYSLYAPQDVKGVINIAGGAKSFLARMDTLFYRGHFDVTNEPGFLIPVMYNWAGRPDKTADAVTLLLEKYFTDSRAGIPGNDDSGAMSSWMLFQTIGFYPDAGQDFYLIGSPSIPDVTITLGNGKKVRVIAKNLDASRMNHYVQSMTLNGQPWMKNWFRQSDIARGAVLVFVMGPAPTKWGTTDLPPSMSDPDWKGCESAD